MGARELSGKGLRVRVRRRRHCEATAPKEIHRRPKERGKRNHRSLNSERLACLQEAVMPRRLDPGEAGRPDGGRGPPSSSRSARDPHWCVPSLWRSEFRNVVVGQVRRGAIDLAADQELVALTISKTANGLRRVRF
jgi:hypothetical protein